MKGWRNYQLKVDYVSLKQSGIVEIDERKRSAGNTDVHQASPSRDSAPVPLLVESPGQIDEGINSGKATSNQLISDGRTEIVHFSAEKSRTNQNYFPVSPIRERDFSLSPPTMLSRSRPAPSLWTPSKCPSHNLNSRQISKSVVIPSTAALTHLNPQTTHLKSDSQKKDARRLDFETPRRVQTQGAVHWNIMPNEVASPSRCGDLPPPCAEADATCPRSPVGLPRAFLEERGRPRHNTGGASKHFGSPNRIPTHSLPRRTPALNHLSSSRAHDPSENLRVLPIDTDSSSWNSYPSITQSDWDQVLTALTDPKGGSDPFDKSGDFLGIHCEYSASAESIRSLSRICLVNYDGCEIFNAHVRPINNERKPYSDPCDSDDVSFQFARALVKASVRDKIVAGHHLVRDFTLLKISHPWMMIRDTATYLPLMLEYLSHRRCCVHREKNLLELASTYLPGIPQIEVSKIAMEVYKTIQVYWENDILEYGMINHLNPNTTVFTEPQLEPHDSSALHPAQDSEPFSRNREKRKMP